MRTHPRAQVFILTLSLTIRRWRRHWEGWSGRDDVRAKCPSLIVHTVGFIEMSVLFKKKEVRKRYEKGEKKGRKVKSPFFPPKS